MRAQLPPTRRRWRPRGDDGVSPIIGSILILVIMMLAIGGIIAWGIPAIQGLQDRAEFESVLTQFLQLDSDVRNLRDPQNTRVATVSIAHGTLSLGSGDRWVVTGGRDAAYNGLYLTGWEGSGASVTISGVAIGATNQISLDVAKGSSFTNKYSCTATCSNTVPLNGASLANDVLRLQVSQSGTVRTESWIFNVGRLTYSLHGGGTRDLIHIEMGAVFTQQGQVFFIHQTPSVKDPDYAQSPKDTNLFVRMLQLTGPAASQSNQGRYPVVFNLVDNYGASKGRPSFDPATMARIQVNGDLEPAFCNYLDARTNWDQVGVGNCEAGDVNVRYLPTGGNTLTYDLNHAVVTTTVRGV